MSIYAKVIVDIANTNVDRIFEYRVPDGINVFIGGRVRVPFRSSLIEGCVLGLTKKPDYDISKIKDIVELIDEEPILTEEQVKLAQLIKSEYRTTLAFALRLMYPAAMRGQRVKEKKIMMAALNQDADVEALKRQCYAKNGALKAKNRLRTIEMLEKGEAPLSILDALGADTPEMIAYACGLPEAAAKERAERLALARRGGQPSDNPLERQLQVQFSDFIRECRQ